MTPPELTALEDSLATPHGEDARPRIRRGLIQVSSLWTEADGDLAEFARSQFVSDPMEVERLAHRLEAMLEQIDGHLNEIGRELRTPTDLDTGPLLKVDPLLAALDLGAHALDDLFSSKIAFVALLNFPLVSLAEKTEQAAAFTRAEWATMRLTDRFARRVPAKVLQEMARAGAEADLYIAEYNIWMHHLLDASGARLFPKGLRLISHWNLRDELKANYSDPRGLEKQRMIVAVMSRIVDQSIPQIVIGNPHVDWNPFTNVVSKCPSSEVEEGAPSEEQRASSAREPDVRYAKLLRQFRAAKAADPYSPSAPTAIIRAFEQGRELSEARVAGLLRDVLESPVVPKVAALIAHRLGRNLEPQDLWYSGFKTGDSTKEAELDAIVSRRYPSREAFASDIPRILRDLEFSKERADYLAERIVVDPSRGAGHAMPALRRGDRPRLRTRIEKDGMNYKGYNIAIHELGHNVEQVFSLYDVDHTLLQGVPNNAFTEALAFVFQARDLDLLGLRASNSASASGSGPTSAAAWGRTSASASGPTSAAASGRTSASASGLGSGSGLDEDHLRILNTFWQTWEIAGVALVDLEVWHWMYDHPNASSAELREAVGEIASSLWAKYYAPVLGQPESVLLGIYSHMIAYPLYLADYPLGHLIAFQIEEHLEKGGRLGDEFERMAKHGRLIPDAWMVHATGAPVSAEPLLAATETALTAIARTSALEPITSIAAITPISAPAAPAKAAAPAEADAIENRSRR